MAAHTNASPRLLVALEQLLALPATELHEALNRAAEVIRVALDAEKVDAFLYDPSHKSLIAAGTGDSQLSREQVAAGLHVLPVANGGRVVSTFHGGEPYRDGRVDQDEHEILGIRETLRVKSTVMAPIDVAGERRGVLAAASTQSDFFSEDDLRFVVTAARWVGALTHRVELVRDIEQRGLNEGRRLVAEELVAVVAHDLRNYLAPIVGRLTLIESRAAHEQRSADLRDAQIALRALETLNRLVTDLLDAERLERGLYNLDLCIVDVARVARDVAMALSTEDVAVVVDGPPSVVVVGDLERLRQVFDNLISNAVKYSPKKSPVLIRVQTETDFEGGQLVVADCIDHGPGVPAELAPHVFQRFARARESKGLGLGLHLAKRIAQLHGGDLTLEPQAATGARFRLRLPVDSNPTPSGPNRS